MPIPSMTRCGINAVFVATLTVLSAGCGSGGATSATDAGSDIAGSAECEAHCTCTGLVCSGIDGDPHGGYAGCIAACEAWTAEELACAQQWCEPGMWSLPKSFRSHACDHAWLATGLDVCLGLDHDASGDTAARGDTAGSLDASAGEDALDADSDGAETAEIADGDADAADGDGADGATDAGATDGETTDETTDDTAETSDVPDTPEDPDTPDVPDTTDVADAADVPDSDDVPDSTDVPDSDDVPDSTDVPDADDVPDAGPVSACQAHCSCMTNFCSGFSGYPYANAAACIAACEAFSPVQANCFPNWCLAVDKVTSTAVKSHACNHAWGALGIDECSDKGWKGVTFDECIFAKCGNTTASCAKVDYCGSVGVCSNGCDWEPNCIAKVCKPKVSQAAWDAFQPVKACAIEQGCLPP